MYRHVVPYVGSMLVDEMAISHWQPVFKRMRDNDAETYAGEVLSRMKTIFSYCIRIELIKGILLPICVLSMSANQ